MTYKTLFYISKTYSIPIIQPLMHYLKQRNNRFAFFVSSKVWERLPEEWHDFQVFRYYREAIQYRPDIVICPGNFVDFRIPGIKVQIFHGLGIEKSSHYRIRHFFDVYLTSGPAVTNRFKQLQRRYRYFLVEETGWPKIDYIVGYPSQNIRKNFKIDKNKNVILYAPTHSRKMRSAEELLPVIPKITRDDEVWFIKFHEFMEKDVIRKFYYQRSGSIKIIDDYDITPYLHLADVLVSDTSSVVYEFMALDKPVITFRTLYRQNKGINISDPSELREALDRSIKNPEEFHKQRMHHLQEVNPYLDGKISERVFHSLEKIMTRGLPQAHKPLNLIRKFQILYHEKFKSGYLR